MSSRLVASAAVIDALLLLVFVTIGRGNHQESADLPGLLTTWWPFLAGLAVAWAALRVWRNPLGIAQPGILLVTITVAVGMLLRAVTGQGVQVSFVIVTVVVVAAFLLGWRAVAALILSRRRKTSR